MSLFSRFVASDTPEFHSHAIAKSDDQQAQSIGSTDRSSFDQRRSVEDNRQMVAGYHAAGVVKTYRREAKLSAAPLRSAVRHKPDASKSKSTYRTAKPLGTPPPRSPHEAPVVKPVQRTSFSEPSSRRFSPFG